MNRSVLAALLLFIPLLSIACRTSSSPRRVENLNRGWEFARADAAKPQRVDLPHTWNIPDGADGGNDYYRGVGTYRRDFKISEADLKKSLFLRFDGAALVTDVFVNDQHLERRAPASSAIP